MIGRTRSTLALALWVIAAACGGSGDERARTIAAICDQRATCVCPGDPAVASGMSGEDYCRTTLADREVRLKGYAEELGLEYDPRCLDVRAAYYAALGCEFSLPTDDCAFSCQPLHGDRKAGESCTQYATGADIVYASDCAPGLSCSDAEICVVACDGQAGDFCEDYRNCAADHYCPHATRLCAPRRPPGDPCILDTYECVDGHTCDRDMLVCQPYHKVGESCETRVCEPGVTCHPIDRVCAVAQLGEPCEDVDCAPGAFCDFNLATPVCVTRPQAGDACDAGITIDCALGITCDDSVCVVEPDICTP